MTWAEAYEYAKDHVTALDVADRYGLQHNRAAFCRCPFHGGDDTPSLKLYPGRGGWHCFGCGAGGSVIDLTMKLLNLTSPRAALRQLDDDFRLGLELDRELTYSERARARRAAADRQEAVTVEEYFERWRWHIMNALNDMVYASRMIADWHEPSTRLKISLTRWEAWAEWTADTLANGTLDEQFELFLHRGEVEDRCLKIIAGAA